MKKALSLALAIIMIFGVAAVGITEPIHLHAEAAEAITATESNFVYEVKDGLATVIGYNDKDSTDEIVIPDTLGGYPVRYLAAESFKGCQCIAITIPASVTRIDHEAFAYDMPNIERFTVLEGSYKYKSDDNGVLYSTDDYVGYQCLFAYPKNAPAEVYTVNGDNTIAYVAPFAFSEAANLKEITLNGIIASVADYYAFYNAKKLEKFTCRNLWGLGDYAFAGCSSLSDVNFNLEGAVQWLGWDSFEGTPFINNPENYDEDGVFYYQNNILATLPEADKVYYEIKAGTVSVAGGAFDWDSLKEVYIPSSVKNIYANPFARCCNLEKFTVQPGGNYQTDKNGVLKTSETIIAYPNGIYQTCYVVDSLVTQINGYAFYLSPIKNFYIPSYNFNSMGYLALGGDGVTDIHFAGDEGNWERVRHTKQSYEKITAAEDVAQIHYNDYSADEHSVTVNNEMYATCTCGYTAEYVPGEGDYYENGFSYNVVNGKAEIVSCTKTAANVLVIPETLGGYAVTRVLDKAFIACNCKTLVIPATVTDFGLGAFWALENLQKITVSPDNGCYSSDSSGILYNADKTELLLYPKNAPATAHTVADTVKEIAPSAFYGVKNLEEITITSNVEKIGDFSFENASIKKLVIEEGVRSIGNSAFYACEALEDVTLPDNLEYIGFEAFASTTKFIGNLSNYDSDGVFYYGDYLLWTYYTDGEEYYNIKDGTKLVANSAFNWTNLKQVIIPKSVEFIGGSAFSEATSLEKITVISNNKHFSVDDYGVLYNYDKTKLIAYPVGLDSICYGIPRGVTEIGEWAFNNVQFLKCVNMPLDVISAGEFAFGVAGAKCIKDIRYEGTRVDWEKINIAQSASGWVSCEKSINKIFSTYHDGEHTLEYHNLIEPDCINYGSEWFTCSCGYKYTKNLPATGHIPEEEYRVEYEPRCETNGQVRLYCSVCEKELDRKNTPSLGHDKEFVEYLEPTCHDPGGSLYHCNRCGADIFEEEEPPVDHDKEFIEYIEPTCYSEGGSVYKCKMCEEEFYVVEEPALEHASSGEKIIIEPTCTGSGGLYYACKNCGEPVELIERYEATGHTEGEWKCTSVGTCEQKRVDTLYCATCNRAIESKVGDYGDHGYTGTIVEQTCTSVITWYYCALCGDNYYEEVTSDIGHITETVTVEPTCTEAGKTYNRCTVCGTTVGYITVIDPLEHTWSEEVVTDSTCSEEGVKSMTCTVCGETGEEIIPKLAHTFGKWEYESGNTFSGICSVCGNSFESIQVELTLDNESIKIYNKTSKKLTATATENITSDIEFTSSNAAIATVDAAGKVTAKSPGKAVITARIKGTDITAECEINVLARSFGIEWISDGETIDYYFVEEGSAIEAPEAPVKAGYVFVGWSPEIPDTMPAQSLTFTAVYNIVSQSAEYDVSATYSVDAFNEPVSLDVKEIEGEREPGGVYMVDGQNYNQVGLYNIKAVNEESEVVQPNEGHKVTIRLALPASYANRTEFVVYHRFVDGTREQLSTAKGTLKVENGYLIFEVSSFSEFEVLSVASTIEITKLPDKTVYSYKTDKIDLTGIVVTFKNANGTTKTIDDPSMLTVSGFNNRELGKQVVTVNYGQYSAPMQITVTYTWWQFIINFLTFGLYLR